MNWNFFFTLAMLLLWLAGSASPAPTCEKPAESSVERQTGHRVDRRSREAGSENRSAGAGPYVDAPFPAPKMTILPSGPPPFEYVDVGAKIPNYIASEKWGEQGEPFHKMQKPLARENR